VREARITLALDSLHDEHKECLQSLELTVSPQKHRGVRATRDFAPGTLNLVPITMVITLKKVGADMPVGAIVLDVYTSPSGDTHNVVLMPGGGLKMPKDTSSVTGIGAVKDSPPSAFVAPFWLVKSAENDAEANMVVKTVKTDLLGNVKIPIITNAKAIRAGAELQVKPTPKVTPEPSAKRPKK
jgi:hypothetical protein